MSKLHSLILAPLLLGAYLPVQAGNSWYVRADGGNADQCDGRADQAFDQARPGQSCAWSHPFIALPPGGPARMAGGDTLYIGSGSYRMGLGAPGSEHCAASYSWECHMASIPSGPTAARPTRILGQGHSEGCTAAPELWGAERAWMVINLEGSSHVELACLEITDRGSCIESHCHNGLCRGEVAACQRDQAPFGDWSPTGISARDSSQVLLRDLNIHGMANRGIYAGRLRDWTLERVTIRANGWAGWDGDIGPDSANSGRLIFRQVEIAYNGCAEHWPSGDAFGCWAQGGGGYGDGLGTAATGGHWIFEDSHIHHNTSDGLDLLYLIDGSQVTINRSRFEGNAGNQLKLARSGQISNSVIIGNCAYFIDEANMHSSDHCRGLGDAVYIGLAGGAQTHLDNNVISGQGNCLISSGQSDRHSRLRLSGNLLLGMPNWHKRNAQSCLYYADSNHGTVVWEDNVIDQVHRNHCPPGNRCGSAAIRNDVRLERLKPVISGPLKAGGGPASVP
jgi:hypothetical protein